MRQALLAFYAPEAESWRPQAPPELDRYDTIELDAETTGVSWPTGDRPVGFAIGYGPHRQYLPFAHRGGGNLDENVVKFWVQRELRDKRIRNLYTKFDLHMFRVWGLDLRAQNNTFHDVGHDAALLSEESQSFSLDALAQKELKIGKLDVGPKEAIADLPAGAVAEYAERDVDLVAKLAAVYAPRLRAQGLNAVSQLEDNVLPAVVEMESHGMPIDLELLGRWLTTTQTLIEALSYELFRQAGFHVNPDSPLHMTRLFRRCNEPMHYTALGQPSFTAPIVLAAAERHPVIRLAWRLGKLRDLRSKYLVQYSKKHVNGVLYPTLNQLPTDEGGTISGRFSCVKPNMQQVLNRDKHDRQYKWLLEYGPEDYQIKRLFRPASGVWCSADMKQVEYRIFAAFTESQRLIQRYVENSDVDFHAIVGEFIRHVRPDVTRTEIKIANFLTIFGGQSRALASNLNISHDAALALSETYHREFPEAQRLLDRAQTIALHRGYVKSVLGRRSRFPDGQRLHKALNAAVQSSAADANKLAIVAAYEARQRLGLTMRMTVHDSLETDLADASALDEYAALLNTQRLPLSVPLLWSVTTGPSWASTH